MVLAPYSHSSVPEFGNSLSARVSVEGDRVRFTTPEVCLDTRFSGSIGRETGARFSETLSVRVIASIDRDLTDTGDNWPVTDFFHIGRVEQGLSCVRGSSFEAFLVSPPNDGTYNLGIALYEGHDLDSPISTVFPGFSGNAARLSGGEFQGYRGPSNNLSFSGLTGYSISGGQVTLEVDRVSNSSSTRSSGTLYLSLVASSGDTPLGQNPVIARASLAQQFVNSGALPQNSSFSGVSVVADYVFPGYGAWNLFLVLSEFPDLNTILDSVAYEEPVVFEPRTDSPLNGVSVVDITDPDDTDFFRFELDRAGILSVFENTGLRSFARLFDSSGLLLAEDNESGGVGDFRIERLLQPGSYELEVGLTDGAEGSFNLLNDFVPELPLEDEIQLRGGVGYTVSGESVTISVDEIANTADFRPTRRLGLQLLVSPAGQPLSPASESVGIISLDAYGDDGVIAPGRSIEDIVVSGRYFEPDPGRYSVYLVLIEFGEDENIAVDFIEFENELIVLEPPSAPEPSPESQPTPTPPPESGDPGPDRSGSAGSTSGGGGAFGAWWILSGLFLVISQKLVGVFFGSQGSSLRKGVVLREVVLSGRCLPRNVTPGLISGVIGVLLTGVPAAVLAGNADHCVDYDRGEKRFHNRCSFEIEVAWCSRADGCDGGFNNLTTIRSGGWYPANLEAGVSTIWGAACRGKDSMTTFDGSRAVRCE
jgi:hypothetical protein